MLIAKTVFTLYPKRTVLCLSLFIGQAFLYNAFFFTYGDSLSTFLGVDQTGYYIAAFAVSNFAGALLLSRLFDTVGRVKMIAGTYILSGVLLGIAGFVLGDLTAMTLTIFGMVIFFFASAGASAAYLTASEVFPMETRALCIAFFYAVGTAIGGITGPLLFGKLIDNASASGDITGIAPGYFLGAALMVAGGIVAIFLGVHAEGEALENIARPLTAEDADSEGGAPARRRPDLGARLTDRLSCSTSARLSGALVEQERPRCRPQVPSATTYAVKAAVSAPRVPTRPAYSSGPPSRIRSASRSTGPNRSG